MSARNARYSVLAALAVAVAVFAASTSPIAAAPAPARFHLALKRAEPAVNDTVAASPKELKLWFTQTVTASGTSVRLMNPTNEALELGQVSVDTAALSPAVVPVSTRLASGTYTVMWRALASDGHPTNGKFAFTVR